MLVTFEDYQASGGRAVTSEKDYSRLEPMVEQLIDAYIKVSIPYWRIKKLDEYGLDLRAVIVNQLEFVEEHGGIDYFLGNTDMTVKSVTTSGFSYSVDEGKNSPALYNLPLSAIAKIQLDNELLRSGLGSKVFL